MGPEAEPLPTMLQEAWNRKRTNLYKFKAPGDLALQERPQSLPLPPAPRAHLPLGQRTWALMGPRGCGNQYFFSPKAQLWEAHSRCFMRWDAWHPSTMGGAHGRCSASTQVWNGAGHTVGPQETPPGAQALLCVHPCADGLGLAHLGLTPSMPHVTSSKNLSLPRPQFPHL